MGTKRQMRYTRLAAATTGRLMKLKAREGDRVTTGQILAVQDDRIDRATLAELEPRQRFFEADYERKENTRPTRYRLEAGAGADPRVRRGIRGQGACSEGAHRTVEHRFAPGRHRAEARR